MDLRTPVKPGSERRSIQRNVQLVLDETARTTIRFAEAAEDRPANQISVDGFALPVSRMGRHVLVGGEARAHDAPPGAGFCNRRANRLPVLREFPACTVRGLTIHVNLA